MITSDTLLQQINPDDISKVISYSQNINNPKVDDILTQWANSKSILCEIFLHGKIKYTYKDKIQFHLTEELQNEHLDNLIQFIVSILNDWDHPLAVFLSALSTKEFYNNCLEKDYVIDEKENKIIRAGAKVIKSFKYFLDDEILLHHLQDKASMLIQENNVEGYLTFSIHPLDFLSSSENNNNWRSCHALDGEYRTGNLSYMCDSSTMMVYLSNEKQEKLPHFPEDVLWNSKKWRMLMYFDAQYEVCFAGKQYPFFSPGALEVVHDIFSNHLVPFEKDNNLSMFDLFFLNQEKWVPWRNTYLSSHKNNDDVDINIEEERYCIINKGVYDRFHIVHNAKHSKHFNDVLSSSNYTKPYYMFKERWGPNYKIEFNIGSAIKCLECGIDIIEDNDTMLCCQCSGSNGDNENYVYCNCCDTRIHVSEAAWVGDEALCPICVINETFECADCGERYFNGQAVWSAELNSYVCRRCYNERSEN